MPKTSIFIKMAYESHTSFLGLTAYVCVHWKSHSLTNIFIEHLIYPGTVLRWGEETSQISIVKSAKA